MRNLLKRIPNELEIDNLKIYAGFIFLLRYLFTKVWISLDDDTESKTSIELKTLENERKKPRQVGDFNKNPAGENCSSFKSHAEDKLLKVQILCKKL